MTDACPEIPAARKTPADQLALDVTDPGRRVFRTEYALWFTNGEIFELGAHDETDLEAAERTLGYFRAGCARIVTRRSVTYIEPWTDLESPT